MRYQTTHCLDEQGFNGKQKDDMDGAAVPTPYIQQYFSTITKKQRDK